MSWLRTHMWRLRIQRHVSVAEVPPEKQGILDHVGLPHGETPCQKEEPANMRLGKSARIPYVQVGQKAARNSIVLLKGQHKHAHLQALTLGSSRWTEAWKTPETHREKPIV